MMKNFLLPKCGSSRYFYRFFGSFYPSGFGFFSESRPPAKMRSDYFQYTQPIRKKQIWRAAAAGGSDRIVRNFGLKTKLAIALEFKLKVKENVSSKTI